jgi:hypothetical protein
MLLSITEEIHNMKRGHVTGHKQERTGKGWWYQTEEVEAIIRQLEAEWQARQQQAEKQ